MSRIWKTGLEIILIGVMKIEFLVEGVSLGLKALNILQFSVKRNN